MTFAALGGTGLSVVASLTAQNSKGVTDTLSVSGPFVAHQIETLLADMPPAASKTGLLCSAEVVEAVASLADRLGPVVVDPVLGSTGGQNLVSRDVPDALCRKLLPVAALVTPNLAEAAVLAGFPVEDRESMLAAGRSILETGVGAVLVKGGHLRGDPVDLLLTDTGTEEFSDSRLEVPAVRGTGCALSAAIAAGLAGGDAMRTAVIGARRFVRKSLATAAPAGCGAWHLGRAD